ncbi:paraquat-inducible protein A, partial [Candidatus Symbiopectobacterium sp. NZEC135]|uniref:paraquat-inducible protein A n=1 Tax=Candidatus Symbiopectobacterium sp. NZEC135 TaxID=2820471 RepID=UPI002227BB9D
MGTTSEISLFEIPQVMVSDNYASVAFLFMLFVQVIPALSMVMVILLSLRGDMPLRLKRVMAIWLFWLKSWGMAEIFLA